jgi:aminopeptidase N
MHSRLWTSVFLLLALNTGVACHAAEPGQGFDVLKYELTISVDIATKSVAGIETVQLRSLTDDLRTITFSGNALTVDSASLNGHPVHVSNAAKALSFELPQALTQGKPATLRIVYHGSPRQGVTFTPTSVYTSYFACDWMICSEDSPGDKAMFALDLHVPAGMTSLSIGELAGTSKLKDGGEIDHWRTKLPYSAYLYDFAIGNFAKASTRQDGVELTYLSDIAISSQLLEMFGETGAMVKFLSDKAGVGLPSGAYTQLLVPGVEAQEAATYSIIGKDYLDPKNDWVTVHELSHQWWGNLITCATWKDFWLNEGITDFMVAAWQEQGYGRAMYDKEMNNERKGVDDLRKKGWDKPLAYGGEYPSSRERRIIQYGKGALFMDHLRTMLGDDLFWAGLRSYTGEHAGGTVTSIDFERSMEKSSGRDLSEVFAEWVFGQPAAGVVK